MDYNALVEAIVARVAEKIANCENTGLLPACNKPKLLILTQEHGEVCHKLLESKCIGEHCRTICALMEEDHVNADEFEGAVLYNLTNDALAKIAGGICDTKYSALVMKLILLGKPLFAARDQVELFRYEGSAPAPYYTMLREKLTLLERSGLTVCCPDELESRILSHLCNASASVAGRSHAGMPSARTGKEYKLDKKVISERDIKSVDICGITVLRVGAKAILTDLAKEYAHSNNIEIVRD